MSPVRLQSVSYSQAHLRLKVDRARPSQFACSACGDPAREWAYMGGDADELSEYGMKYSLDQDRYEPMCFACHRRHDRALADGRTVDVCSNGHLWAENTGVRVKRSPDTGLRFCLACNRERTRVYREANREMLADRRHASRRAARKAEALAMAVA